MRVIKIVTAAALFLACATPAAALEVFGPGTDYNGFCPQLSLSMERGATDYDYYGQVTELQKFLADYFSIAPSEIVSGTFGPTTELYVQRFQQQNGLEWAGRVGEQTRAVIETICPITRTDLPTAPRSATPPPPPPQVSPSFCSITSDMRSAANRQKFTLTWGTFGIVSPVLWQSGRVGTELAVPKNATKQYIVGTDISANTAPTPRIETFNIGEKPAAGAVPRSLCSVSVSIVSGTGAVAPSVPLPASASNTGPMIPTLYFVAIPDSVPLGEKTSLQWTSANTSISATRCYLEYDGTKQELRYAGVKMMQPTVETIYKMTCLNTANGFSVEKNVRVLVGPPRPVPPPVTPRPTTGGDRGGGGGGGGDDGFQFGLQDIIDVMHFGSWGSQIKKYFGL